nr:hypothetical protein [Tanacetum cinerariifolium]
MLSPSGGYHVVPPQIIGNFMPPKPDLVYNTAPLAVESDHSAFNVQVSPAKPAQAMSHTTLSMAPIIEDWVSDSEDEFKPNYPQSTKPTPRNSTHRGCNKQYASFTKKYSQKPKVPVAVLLKSKPVSIAAVRQLNAVVSKIMKSRPNYAYTIVTKSISTIRRYKTCSQSSKTSNSSPKVTTAKALMVSDAKGKKGKWVWRPTCPILDHDSRTI